MPYFLTQFKYPSSSWQSMVRAPVDRFKMLSTMIDAMGGKMLCGFYCYGEYDGMIVAEADTEEKYLAIIVSVISSGGVSDVKTTVLFDSDKAMKAFEIAKNVPYQPPS